MESLIRPETADALRGACREVDAALGSLVAAFDELVDDLAGRRPALAVVEHDERPEPQCVCGLPRHHPGECADDAARASTNTVVRAVDDPGHPG